MKKTISIILMAVVGLFFLITTAHAAGSGEMKIITNGYTAFAIKSDGTVMGWGRNTNGEVGNGNTTNQPTPAKIPELANVNQIICANVDSASFYAIKPDGGVLAWGANQYGQLGIGSINNQLIPVAIPGLTGISQIKTDGFTAYAVTAEGNVYAWGKNNYGQVGNNSTVDQKTPVRLSGLSNIQSITCSAAVAYAIKDDKTVYAWGYGLSGQIGNNEFVISQKTPVKIPNLSNIGRIITNGNTTFAISADKTKLYGWGYGPFGQVGCYSGSNQSQPRLIGLSNINDVVITNNDTYAIITNGILYGWGQNMYGQLGNDSFFDRNYPLQISGVPRARQIISSDRSACMLGVDNSVYAWGENHNGEVGNGSAYPQKSPCKIQSLNNISKIAGNGSTLFAIANDGTAYGWGQNPCWAGNQLTPIGIPVVNDVEDIQIFGSTTTFAKSSNKMTYGWGSNLYGQLGENNVGQRVFPPVEIAIKDDDNPELSTTVTGTGNVNSIVPIAGSIDALTISVTHPANVAYSIDPNDDSGFAASEIVISNNSKVAVNVSIQSFKSAPGGSLQFIDVLPTDKNWDILSLEETKKYIALGLQLKNEGEWLSHNPIFLNPIYAAALNNTSVGVLARASSGALKLSAKHGLAFDQEYISRHNLVFVFSLI